MRSEDIKILSDFFDGNYREYGYDPRSLGWNAGTQQARFNVMAAVGDLEGCSVLDVGCGFGDFYGFLKEQGIHVDYTGIDLSQEFVKIAREHHPDARFIVGDFEENGIDGQYDWVFECGIFNRKVGQQRRFVERTLRRMYEVSKIGMAADFLSPKKIDLVGHVYHADPGEMIKFCKSLSPYVILRWDYKPQEFCMYVYRDNNPKSAVKTAVEKIRQFEWRKGRSWG